MTRVYVDGRAITLKPASAIGAGAHRSDGAGHTLRAIDEDGPEALLGVSAALDAALEQLALEVPWHSRSGCT